MGEKKLGFRHEFSCAAPASAYIGTTSNLLMMCGVRNSNAARGEEVMRGHAWCDLLPYPNNISQNIVLVVLIRPIFLIRRCFVFMISDHDYQHCLRDLKKKQKNNKKSEKDKARLIEQVKYE